MRVRARWHDLKDSWLFNEENGVLRLEIEQEETNGVALLFIEDDDEVLRFNHVSRMDFDTVSDPSTLNIRLWGLNDDEDST